jgi:hypothetical protein
MNEPQIAVGATPVFDVEAKAGGNVDAQAGGGMRQRFFPDYNAAATLYWALLGSATVRYESARCRPPAFRRCLASA